MWKKYPTTLLGCSFDTSPTAEAASERAGRSAAKYSVAPSGENAPHAQVHMAHRSTQPIVRWPSAHMVLVLARMWVKQKIARPAHSLKQIACITHWHLLMSASSVPPLHVLHRSSSGKPKQQWRTTNCVSACLQAMSSPFAKNIA